MKLLLLGAGVLFAMLSLAQTRASQSFSTAAGPVKITPIYHASLLLEAAGKAIYVDPAKPADFAGLPPADLVLITHTHGDHMDPASIEKLSRDETQIWGPESVAKTVTRAHVIASGGSRSWNGWTIEAVPAYNIARGPAPGRLYHDKGAGVGYVLAYGGTRFYVAGDTEGVPEVRTLKKIDVAFVPMNLPYTMPPDEAADAVKAFHPRVVVPYHYRGSDLSAFQKALEGSGIEVRLLDWYPK